MAGPCEDARALRRRRRRERGGGGLSVIPEV